MTEWNGKSLSLAGALILTTTLAVPATAQEPTIEVVAEGLDNPRGLTIAPNGDVYVAEAGLGGEMCMEDAEVPGGQFCIGSTGSISRVVDGRVEPVIDGLPSAGFGTEFGGPSDIDFIDESTFFVTGNLGGDPADREGMPPELGGVAGWLLRGSTDGTLEPFADVAAFEATSDPDAEFTEGIPDSNPHSVAVIEGGAVVADAGGNSLVSVDESGAVALVAVFPPREVMVPLEILQGMAQAEGEGAQAELEQMIGEGEPPEMVPVPAQAVPTSVVVGPDEAYYVGQLTGFPFPVGEAKVLRVTPEGEVSDYASGLTNIIDLAFAPDGTLYVAEIAHAGLMAYFGAGQTPIGAVLSVPPGGGDATLVATGEQLMAPGGIAATEDAVFVTVGNLSAEPGMGAIVRIDR